ncbi:MAG: hypothetical protein JRJ85_11490 [Deltaproteobacteria bacterium]|nr:hypothetical protein [Deltaproteobacteria bacterium]
MNLFDGDADAGGALYAGILLGLDIEDLLVNNIYSTEGLNIYYMAALNSELQGLTYALQGGGQLMAVGEPVPIPGAVWLLASGLILFLGFRRSKVPKVRSA